MSYGGDGGDGYRENFSEGEEEDEEAGENVSEERKGTEEARKVVFSEKELNTLDL